MIENLFKKEFSKVREKILENNNKDTIIYKISNLKINENICQDEVCECYNDICDNDRYFSYPSDKMPFFPTIVLDSPKDWSLICNLW